PASVGHSLSLHDALPILQALWWDAKGDWNKAHECAQARDDAAGMSVHAYLHRKEGDQENAGYWYRRIRRPPATVSLDEEWEELADRKSTRLNSSHEWISY